MTEEWKDIKGFEGVYQISSLGRLKSFRRCPLGRIMLNTNKNGGYFSVVLQVTRHGEPRYTRIHRLVAEAFIPNHNNSPEVNHKDGNRQNNNVSNLEWVTRRQNMAHAVKIKPWLIDGMKEYNQKIRPIPVIQITLDGLYVRTYKNSTEASTATGICKRNILQVASGAEYKPGMKRMQAGGFNWVFMHTFDFGMDLSHVHKSNREFVERQRLCAELFKRNASRRSRNANGGSQKSLEF